jgi:hypothetical protein
MATTVNAGTAPEGLADGADAAAVAEADGPSPADPLADVDGPLEHAVRTSARTGTVIARMERVAIRASSRR